MPCCVGWCALSSQIRASSGTLISRGVISAKKAERYATLREPLAAIVGDKNKLARLRLPELQRFVGKLQSLARRVKKAKGRP